MKKTNKLSLLLVSIFVLIILSMTTSATLYDPFTNATIGDIGKMYISLEEDHETMVGILYTDTGKEYLVFGIGSCNTVDNYKICFKDIAFNLTKNEYVVVGNDLYPKVDLSIDKQVSEVKVSKDVSTTVASLGDNVKVTVDIDNSGDTTANDIFYQEIIDSRFEIISYHSSFKKNDQGLYWDAKLLSGTSKELYYIISTSTPATYKSDSELTYTSLDNKFISSITEKAVSFEEKYKYSINISKSEFPLGENTTLTIMIKNQDRDEPFEINNMRLTFNSKVTPQSTADLFSKNINYYEAEPEDVPKASTKYFHFTFTPNFAGEGTVKYNLLGRVGGESVNEEKTITFSVLADGLKSIFEFKRDKFSYNEEGDIILNFINSEDKLSYNNINCEADIADYGKYEFSYDEIKPGETIKHNLVKYIGQKFDIDKNVRIYLVCTYETEFGEKKTLISDDFIKVKKYSSPDVDIVSDEGNNEDKLVTQDSKEDEDSADDKGNADEGNADDKDGKRLGNEGDKSFKTQDSDNQEMPSKGIISSIINFFKRIF